MTSRAIMLAAFAISLAAAAPGFAQMGNGSMMKGDDKGVMSKGGDMPMSKSQMATMKRCHAMSERRMMKSKTCSNMMKMHSDMMKGDAKM